MLPDKNITPSLPVDERELVSAAVVAKEHEPVERHVERTQHCVRSKSVIDLNNLTQGPNRSDTKRSLDTATFAEQRGQVLRNPRAQSARGFIEGSRTLWRTNHRTCERAIDQISPHVVPSSDNWHTQP